MITFASPFFLGLLLLLPGLVALYLLSRAKRREAVLRFSQLALLKEIARAPSPWKEHLPFAVSLAALSLLIIALARPQGILRYPSNQVQVVITIDTSGSMLAQDFFPNRIGAAKDAAKSFLDRLNRNIPVGIVTFSESSRIVEAPTTDRQSLGLALAGIDAKFGGTAIGDAIMASTNLLIARKAPHKVILLLSDGENNAGIDPQEAALAAKGAGVAIYTVGIGSPEGAFVPGINQMVRLDERALKAIAERTGGEYAHASTSANLVKIFQSFSRKVVLTREFADISLYFVAVAAVALLGQLALSHIWARRLP